MDRRQALKLLTRGGISLGLLAGAGWYARNSLLPPRRSEHLDSVDRLAVRLFNTLDPETRDLGCIDYDHPYRQYHNRGVGTGGIDISAARFSREQRSLLTDLMYAGLSEQGWDRLPQQFFINWPGVHWMRLLICGDPSTSLYQIILSGPHLNLRLGGKNREGVAFGGPLVYGDQRGDYKQGLPRNVYRYQFVAANQLLRSLEPHQQQAALLSRTPIQTQIELQGRHGSFPGIEVSDLSKDNREQVRRLVDSILSTYANEDVAYAHRCLEENGGIDSLFLSYYEEGEVNGSGEYQIFRLEGPAAVLYFRGYPHVHSFINIGMDGDQPLSVGEILRRNPEPLQANAVKAMFEEAMRRQTGADLAYYPAESVVGRLRRGTVRTGDIYNLESWQDFIATVKLRGDRIGGGLLHQLRRAGVTPEPERVYTVATTGYGATEAATASLGHDFAWDRGGMVRDAVIDHLRARGFGPPA